MEAHGVGFTEKIHDIAYGVLVAAQTCPQVAGALDMPLQAPEPDIVPLSAVLSSGFTQTLTTRQIIQGLDQLMREFRGGDHPYVQKFAVEMHNILGFQEPAPSLARSY